MTQIVSISGTGIPLVLDDIDTDRIIPARFLRCVTFDGIGEHAFEDDRLQDTEHPFNKDVYQQGSILISGRNFGCGSSREHAPQSLMRWGIKAVVAESFAEIFFGNCTALGIPAVTANRKDLEAMASLVVAQPHLEIMIDLQRKNILIGDKTYSINMPPAAHEALTTGKWDFLSQLLEKTQEVKSTAGNIPYLNGF